MGYLEYRCEGCKKTHDAASWYFRMPPGGHEYACRVSYTAMANKAGWEPLEPGSGPARNVARHEKTREFRPAALSSRRLAVTSAWPQRRGGGSGRRRG